MPATTSPTFRANSGMLLTTAGIAALFSWVVGVGSALAPMVAQTTAPLSGSYGATTAAVGVTPQVQRVVIWPTTFTGGLSLPAGTPCSNYALPSDAIAYKVLEALGSLRRCYGGKKITTMATPLTAATSGRAIGVQLSLAATTVIKWPTTWQAHINNAVPEPGTPCSPNNLLAGEATTRHIQGYVNTTSSYRRCVPNTEPLWSPP